MDRGRVRVKAMVALVDHERSRQLVSRTDSSTGSFHRLLGGSVEFGELASEAAVREVREELRLTLSPDDLTFLGVLETRFTFEGERGHEVVFVFRAAAPVHLIPAGGGWFEDDGYPMWVEWRSNDARHLPLYPEGVTDLLDRASDRK